MMRRVATRTLPRRRWWQVAAGGVVCALAAAITVAAFTDNAGLAMNGAGFGGADGAFAFEIKDGNSTDLTDASPWSTFPSELEPGLVSLPGADSLAPGGAAIDANIPARNASATLPASVAVLLSSTTDTSAATPSSWASDAGGQPITVGEANANYLAALRFDIALDGVVLAANQAFADVSGDNAISLGAFAPGQAGLITITMRLIDVDAFTYNGGTATVAAKVVADS